jgi:hypothetical protein
MRKAASPERPSALEKSDKQVAMRSFILSLPVKLRRPVIVGLTVVAAFAVSLITRFCVNAEQIAFDSTWITAVYGTMGTLYSVLLAFVVAGVWQSFSNAEGAIGSEASALTDLVFLLRRVSTEKTADVRESTKSYAADVVEKWNSVTLATRENRPVEEVNIAKTYALLDAILAAKPQDEREVDAYAQALTLTETWLDARRSRLRGAQGNTAGALWPLLTSGAFVLFILHGLFVTHTWVVWVLLLVCFSFVVGLSFYLIFSLDDPPTCRMSAGPEPFKWLLKNFERTDGLGI